MKLAIVQDFLVQSGGAERVVAMFHDIFPEAPIYTAVYNPKTCLPDFRDADIRTSIVQKLGWNGEQSHKMMAWLYPIVFENFDLSGYDMVLSSSSSYAKGVITSPECCHVCYCHTPPRFLWRYHDYVARERMGIIKRTLLPVLVAKQRAWDVVAAQRVDHFIANSATSAARIHKFYRRDATIIHPPFENRFLQQPEGEGDFYLIVSRLISYKCIDTAIQAFNNLKLPLHIVGDGPDMHRLRAMAGPTVQFLGKVAEPVLLEQYRQCRALILPGEEDFGLTALEAQASGRPVIAYRAGGAMESVIDGETGVLYWPQTPNAIAAAIDTLARHPLDGLRIQAHARSFNKDRFRQQLVGYLEEKYEEHQVMLRGGYRIPRTATVRG